MVITTFAQQISNKWGFHLGFIDLISSPEEWEPCAGEQTAKRTGLGCPNFFDDVTAACQSTGD